MATLNFIGKGDLLTNLKCNSSVDKLVEWFGKQPIVQFDTETTKTDSVVERELRVMQFGSLDGKEVFVVQVSALDESDRDRVVNLLADRRVLKLIHNASFDYQVMLKEGIVMDNVWDTMVMEQILYAGHDMDLRFYSLAEVLLRRYYIDMSKEMQCEFGDDQLNDEKIIYAATDVVHLGRLYLDQKAEMEAEDIIQLGVPDKDYVVDGMKIPAVTENEVVLAFADIEYNGMGFNPDKWRENIGKAQPVIDKAKLDLAEILTQEPYKTRCEELEVNIKIPDPEDPYNTKKKRTFSTHALVHEGQFTVNWNSGAQALKLYKYIFPDLEGASTLALKTYLQDNDPTAPKDCKPASKEFLDTCVSDLQPNMFSVLKLAILKKFEDIEKFMLTNFRERLTEEGYYIEAGELCINWNSNGQKLEVFRWFVPNAECTDAFMVADNIHIPFFQAFQQYQFANSLVTKYGEKFIQDNVDSDGRVRTRFNTVLATGRVSSSQPNTQQIPANALPEGRQNDYRNCFTPGYDGWSVVGSDFASQELAVIGTLSKDPVFLDALRTGKDLHSTCAEVIYGKRWKDAADEDCAYYALDEHGVKQQTKCKCKAHKRLRTGVKTLNFGLAYGMSEIALSADLKITTGEAKTLMEDYFGSFPKIKGLLDALGLYGQQNGFTRTPQPMRRKRYFPYWKGYHQTSSYMLGKIDRASKNSPIQGLSADMTKIALVLLRRKINQAKVRDRVKLFAQVHDQIDSICEDNLKEFWAKIVTDTLELAAKICLKNDLLKTDTEISKVWQK